MASLLPAALQDLAAALDNLPGIGPLAADRLARRLVLEPALAKSLRQALERADESLSLCSTCRHFANNQQCQLCGGQWLCDAEHPLVILQQPEWLEPLQQSGQVALEVQPFVLHGLLAPAEGVGPEDLGLDTLRQHLENGVRPATAIVCVEDSVEGHTTAYFLQGLMARFGISHQLIWPERSSALF